VSTSGTASGAPSLPSARRERERTTTSALSGEGAVLLDVGSAASPAAAETAGEPAADEDTEVDTVPLDARSQVAQQRTLAHPAMLTARTAT
jgi:hypothetical protein